MTYNTSIASFSEIIGRYDAFLLDLWGVIHDGERLYPGVREVLAQLRDAEKQVIFLSNAPRRAYSAAQVLHNLGISSDYYNHIITSGEVVYGYIATHAELGSRYYFIGPDKDQDVLDGLDKFKSGLVQADFILNVGFMYDHQTVEDYARTLESAVALNKPMICANPDRRVVRQNGQELACAGVIAERYEQMGGKVLWFGKPYAAVYDACLARLRVDSARILAVGDGLETDIEGAVRYGLDSAFVAGGISRAQLFDGNLLCHTKWDALQKTILYPPRYVVSGIGCV